MAQTIIGMFQRHEDVRQAVETLAQNGVPINDIVISKHKPALAVTTEAILGSAVDDMLRAAGAADIEVKHDQAHLTGWERYDPHNDQPIAPHVPGDGEEWQRSSKLGTAAGAIAGATVGAEIGAVGGPIGVAIGGIVGAAIGGATGAAGDVAGELAKENLE